MARAAGLLAVCVAGAACVVGGGGGAAADCGRGAEADPDGAASDRDGAEAVGAFRRDSGALLRSAAGRRVRRPPRRRGLLP